MSTIPSDFTFPVIIIIFLTYLLIGLTFYLLSHFCTHNNLVQEFNIARSYTPQENETFTNFPKKVKLAYIIETFISIILAITIFTCFIILISDFTTALRIYHDRKVYFTKLQTDTAVNNSTF